MGFAKRQGEEKEYYRYIAFKIMIEIGAIDVCDIHEDFYYLTYKYDIDVIYSIVTDRVKREYKRLTNYNFLHEKISEILSEAASDANECTRCKKIENE